jgi:cyclase
MTNARIARFTVAALLMVASHGVITAQAPQLPPLTMKQLKPNVWAGIGGAGGNSTVIIGQTSVIVVDAKQTEAGAKDLLAQIAKITPKPVSTVILTHSDGDHVIGLVAFPAGIKIVAHENAEKDLKQALAAGGRGAPPADKLPNEIMRYYAIGQGAGIEESKEMTIDGVKLEFWHWASGHTSGDLAVYLPAERLVATGDIITTTRADDNPNIHLEKHGSSQGWLWNAKGLVRLDAETYIPGHGDLVTKADIQRKVTATEARRDKIVAMAGQGKTLQEIKAALPETPVPGAAPAAPGATPPLTFVDTVYAEVAKK